MENELYIGFRKRYPQRNECQITHSLKTQLQPPILGFPVGPIDVISVSREVPLKESKQHMLLSYRDPEFWQNFYTQHWQPQVPTVIRQPFKEFPFSEEVLFRAMAGYEERLRGGNQRIPCLVSVADSVKAPRRPLRQLFQEPSKSLEQLEKACAKVFPNMNFGLMINDMQAVDPGIWSAVSAFLLDAHPWVGFPVPRAFLDLFYGSYSTSFTGVHKDTQDIIAFVVRGEKRILAWPFDYFLSRLKGVGPGDKFFNKRLPIDYRKYRKDALILDAQAGDVLYWPSDYWHVAEAQPGRYSAMLSLGLHRPNTLAKPKPDDLTARPKALGIPSQDLTGTIPRPGAAQRLRWLTGLGFQLGSPHEAIERPQSGVTLVKTPSSVVLWRTDLPLNRTLIASNGHSISVPHSTELEVFLKRLSKGEAISLPKKSLAAAKGRSTIFESHWNNERELKTRKITSNRNPIARLIHWLLRVYAAEKVPADFSHS